MQIIDLLFLPNFPRWACAVWVVMDDSMVPLYARMRLVSWWVFWGLSLLTVISYASFELSTNDDVETIFIIRSLLVLVGLIVCIVVDFHFTQVVMYYAKGHDKRVERRNQEREREIKI